MNAGTLSDYSKQIPIMFDSGLGAEKKHRLDFRFFWILAVKINKIQYVQNRDA